MQATMIEITVMSYIDIMPLPTWVNILVAVNMPVPRPTSILSTVPIIRITKTFTPLTAPINTNR